MPQNSEFQRGGRGKKAPYETTHSRIPIPLKNQISDLIEAYQSHIEMGGDPEDPPQFFINNNSRKEEVTLRKVVKKLKVLESHLNAKEKGYSTNSFSQGIKSLKEIFDLLKLVNR